MIPRLWIFLYFVTLILCVQHRELKALFFLINKSAVLTYNNLKKKNLDCVDWIGLFECVLHKCV